MDAGVRRSAGRSGRAARPAPRALSGRRWRHTVRLGGAVEVDAAAARAARRRRAEVDRGASPPGSTRLAARQPGACPRSAASASRRSSLDRASVMSARSTRDAAGSPASQAPSGRDVPPRDDHQARAGAGGPRSRRSRTSKASGRQEPTRSSGRQAACSRSAAEAVADAAVGDRDPLGPAGRARGVEHVGQGLGCSGTPRAGRQRPGSDRIGPIGRTGRSGPRRSGRATHAAARSSSMAPRALRRVARGRAARRPRRPSARQHGHDQLGRALSASATGTRGRRPGRAAGRPGFRPARQLARRSGLPPSARTPRRPAPQAGAPPRSKRTWSGASGGVALRLVPFRQDLVELGRAEERQPGGCRRRRRATAPASRVTKPCSARRMVDASKSEVRYSQCAARSSTSQLEARSNFAVPGATNCHASSLSPGGRRGRSGRENRTSNSGLRDGSRSGCSSSTSFSNGTSWCVKPPRAASRTRPRSSRKEGLPARSMRSGEDVHEEPDQIFGLDAVAVGHRHADHQIVLTRPARQERLERREETMNEVAPSRRARASTAMGSPAGRSPGMCAPARSTSAGRGRSVGRSSCAGAPARCSPPPGELLVEDRAGEPLALPDGEFGVLDWQVGQWARFSRGEGGIESAQLARQDAQRPAVGRDVMEGEEQRVAVRCGPQQLGAEERPGLQIERRPASSTAMRSISVCCWTDCRSRGRPAATAGAAPARSPGAAGRQALRRRWCAGSRGGAPLRGARAAGRPERGRPAIRHWAGML